MTVTSTTLLIDAERDPRGVGAEAKVSALDRRRDFHVGLIPADDPDSARDQREIYRAASVEPDGGIDLGRCPFVLRFGNDRSHCQRDSDDQRR